MLLRTGKAGPLLKPAQYLRGLLPQSHETSAISLSLFLAGKVAYPALSSIRSLGLIRTSLLFDTGAFRCARLSYRPGFPFLRARPRGEPWRLRAERRGDYVQARTVAATTIGADRVAADKVEALLTAAGRACLSVYI